MILHRSYLFAPANQPRRIEKALASAADAIILDLEDTVPPNEKAAARRAACEALKLPRKPRAYVRINALDTPYCYDDLLAISAAPLDGVVVPKIESPHALFALDWLLRQLERTRGIAPGTIDLLPIVESAEGLGQLDAIAASGTRVRRLTFGAGDLRRDLGMTASPDESDILGARERLVLASRRAGLEQPVDTVYFDLKDEAGLARSAVRARGLGLMGKLIIHPDQLAPVHRAFTPSEAEISRAEKVIAAFRAVEASGSAALQVDGEFIDYPIVAQAERVLALVKQIRAKG
jgi:citrate lyase subunit beta/citryl-CoA lyase